MKREGAARVALHDKFTWPYELIQPHSMTVNYFRSVSVQLRSVCVWSLVHARVAVSNAVYLESYYIVPFIHFMQEVCSALVIAMSIIQSSSKIVDNYIIM